MESLQDYIALPLKMVLQNSLLLFSDVFDDNDDGEIPDDIDVDNVDVVGVEDNLGLNPQETWSLKH